MKHLYVKKPIPVEAYQWYKTDGDNFYPAPGFVPEIRLFNHTGSEPSSWCISTAEGWMGLNDEGFIVKGPKGEYWQVRKDIFLETYDAIPQENNELAVHSGKACRQDMIDRGEELIPRSCPRCGLMACRKMLK